MLHLNSPSPLPYIKLGFLLAEIEIVTSAIRILNHASTDHSFDLNWKKLQSGSGLKWSQIFIDKILYLTRARKQMVYWTRSYAHVKFAEPENKWFTELGHMPMSNLQVGSEGSTGYTQSSFPYTLLHIKFHPMHTHLLSLSFLFSCTNFSWSEF